MADAGVDLAKVGVVQMYERLWIPFCPSADLALLARGREWFKSRTGSMDERAWHAGPLCRATPDSVGVRN